MKCSEKPTGGLGLLLWLTGLSSCHAVDNAAKPPPKVRSAQVEPKPAEASRLREAPADAVARADAQDKPKVVPASSVSGRALPKLAEEAETEADSAFPPPDITPPFERSAHPGDGKWVPFGDSERYQLLAGGLPVMYKTRLHPHKISRFLSLQVVAIDLRRVDIGLVPGTADVGDEPELLAELGFEPGLVPPDRHDRLYAVMNGGFQARHGRWGFYVSGAELLSAKPEGCTLARAKDGRLLLGTWRELGLKSEQLDFFRQTPPCLVESSELHPQLEQRRERAWGGHDPKRKTRRRSAVGLDGTARILYYGVGIELEPSQLGEAMRFAGAEVAAQFDINFTWVRFLVFGKEKGRLQVKSSLLPDMVYSKSSYVHRPVSRDFFYLTPREQLKTVVD